MYFERIFVHKLDVGSHVKIVRSTTFVSDFHYEKRDSVPYVLLVIHSYLLSREFVSLSRG